MKRALRPSVQDITEQQQLDDFLASDDYVFLAQLHGDDESLDARFRSLAEEYSDRYSFGIASSPDASSSGIWCYNNVDESENAATDPDDANALKKLVDLCTAEVIPQLTRRNELTHLSVSFYVYIIECCLLLLTPLSHSRDALWSFIFSEPMRSVKPIPKISRVQLNDTPSSSHL